ncbi:MAG: hypothetical protein ACFNM6_03080 [Prevotella sp.]
MASIEDIRKRGIWIIAALTLIALLILNVVQKQYQVKFVILSAFATVVIWLAVMGIWKIVDARKCKKDF